MNRLPKAIQDLFNELENLPADEQRDRHMMLMKRLAEIATAKQVRALRHDCLTCPLCEWLGEEHRAAVIDMLDGHLALRAMRLIRRQYIR